MVSSRRRHKRTIVDGFCSYLWAMGMYVPEQCIRVIYDGENYLVHFNGVLISNYVNITRDNYNKLTIDEYNLMKFSMMESDL